MFRLGEWLIDPATRRLSRADRTTRLTPKAMGVLQALHAARGQVLSRSELLDQIWPDVTVGEEVLTHAVAEIRRALDDSAREPRYVETVHTSGYRLLIDYVGGAVSAVALTPTTAAVSNRDPASPASAARRRTDPGDLMWGAGTVDRGTTTKPSVAVLRLENQSGEPGYEDWAQGLSSDLIAELCRLPDLFAIAATSSFAFGSSADDVAKVRRDLGARYVLGGSVCDAGDRVRITAWLVDAETDRQLWAESHERAGSDLIALCDELAGAVHATLVGSTGDTVFEAVARDPHSDVDAYRRVLRAFGLIFRMTRADADAALDAAKAALVLDPNYGRGHAAVAYAHLYRAFLGVADYVPDALQQARNFARRAIEADRTDYWSYGALSGAEIWTGHHESAQLASERAVALAPSCADMRALNALVLDFAGRAEEALADIELAVRLNPNQPDWYLTILARAHYLLGRHDDAGRVFRRLIAARNEPLPVPSSLLMAANLVAQGQPDMARDLVQRLRMKMPRLGRAELPQFAPFKKTEDRDRFLDLLHQAGLPE